VKTSSLELKDTFEKLKKLEEQEEDLAEQAADYLEKMSGVSVSIENDENYKHIPSVYSLIIHVNTYSNYTEWLEQKMNGQSVFTIKFGKEAGLSEEREYQCQIRYESPSFF
jgi:hypothetical protein